MELADKGGIEFVEGGLEGLATMRGDSYFIPAKTKVIVLLPPMLRMMLKQQDERFARNFQVTAEFEPALPINKKTIDGYLYFLRKIITESGGQIMELTQDAISAVIEHAAELVESNRKVTAQFGVLRSLLEEAAHFARQAEREDLTREDVEAALKARDRRSNVYIRHMKELYNESIFKIQTKGSKVGQPNALAVVGSNSGFVIRVTVAGPAAGDFSITSTDQIGSGTGADFDKSLAVIKGGLQAAYGKKRELKGAVSVSFEQIYDGIDGDSATTTMLYGILSAFSGVPIKQNTAMTGSADQFFEAQTIGGVMYKIQGFFDLVSHRGELNKEDPPTVLVPITNQGDLQLSREVVEAIRAGVFRVIGIRNVMEGIEQLTGVAYAEIMRKFERNQAAMR
jgi:predicted ATP-dependent protease